MVIKHVGCVPQLNLVNLVNSLEEACCEDKEPSFPTDEQHHALHPSMGANAAAPEI
jgi:hypothetical protein